MRRAHVHGAFAVILATLAAGASGAWAADLYVGGIAGFSNAVGKGSGSNPLIGSFPGGDDKDSSPLYGGTLGIAVPLSDVLPWAMRIPSFDIPYWPGHSLHVEGSESFRFPGWSTLIEAEAVTGRHWSFLTPGPAANSPERSELTTTSFIGNVRLDVPIQAPLHVLFGRLPMLEPVTLYGGGGVGAGWNKLDGLDALNSGSDTSFGLAYQFMAGIGYAMSDQLHLSLGWRYLDLGRVKAELDVNPNPTSFRADVTANEFTTSIRFQFYHVPFFGRE